MKHDNMWRFKDELKFLISTNKTQSKTLWSKVKAIIEENEDIFKYANQVPVYGRDFEELERAKRCFNFLKSGFFSREFFSGLYKIDEIICFESFVGGEFSMRLKNGMILNISERDFKDLQYLKK